jgi:AcrR family transcriptional regulator
MIIADAVLRVLADEGSKGLSHRRVDREAGLPIGSTVHHAPTRYDLFMIAAQRLNEMMIDDIEQFALSLQDKGEITPEILAKEIVSFWRTTITPEKFYRLRAEMVLLFSQEFRHDVHTKFRPQVKEFKKFWTRIFTDLGAPEPLRAALEITAWNRGIFSIMAACEGEMNEDEYEMIETWLVKMVNSFLVDKVPQ